MSCYVSYREDKPANAFTWPFRERNWARSLWMPMIWWISPPFLPFGKMLTNGWYLETIRQRRESGSAALPEPRDLGRMFGQGAVLLLMEILYFVIPLSVISFFVDWSLLSEVWDFLVWLWKAVVQSAHEPFWAFLTRHAMSFLAHAAAPVAYLAIAVPLFTAAEMRYARNGQVRSFFDLFGNLALLCRHLGDFLLFLFFKYLVGTLLFAVGVALAVTIVGLPAVAVVGAAETWTVAYLAGDLSSKLEISREKSRRF